MIDAQAFVPATPSGVAGQLGDAVHLWRLPWRREEGRTRLLAVLAGYLGAEPSALQLETGPHGKPGLPAAHRLRFNWSHSGEFALLALAHDLDVGVDIEQAREGVRVMELAQRFFTTEEAATLSMLSGRVCEAAFLQLWTAKEAVLKTLGRGLAFGLDRTGFAFRQGEWHPDHFDAEAGEAQDWQVLPVRIASDYAGAVAWRGPPRPVQGWDLAPPRI